MSTVILIILGLLAVKLLMGIVLSTITTLSTLLMVLYRIMRGVSIALYHTGRLILKPLILLVKYLRRHRQRTPRLNTLGGILY